MKKIIRSVIGTHGFTLLEVMMVVGIIAIIVPIGASVLKNNVKLFNNFRNNYVAFQEARMATGFIIDRLRGYTMLGKTSSDTSDKDVYGYKTSNNTLTPSPAITSIPSNNNNSNFDIYIYNDNNVKYMESNGVKITNTKLTDFDVSNLDSNNFISITITPSVTNLSHINFKLRKSHFLAIPSIQN